MKPYGTWYSPFSNCSLNAEDLVREMALNAVAKIFIVRFLSDEPAEVAMEPDAIAVHAPTLHYHPTMPFPPREANVSRQTQ